jgi:hypothetical protein
LKSTPEGGLKVPETNRLQTCMARKDYLESYVPSRNTGQGDCCHGKLNLLERGKAKGNRICALFSCKGKDEAMDLKGSRVMAVRLETGRSSPG